MSQTLNNAVVFPSDVPLDELASQVRKVITAHFTDSRQGDAIAALYKQYEYVALDYLLDAYLQEKEASLYELTEKVVIDGAIEQGIGVPDGSPFPPDLSVEGIVVTIYPPLSDGRRVGVVQAVDWQGCQQALVEAGIADSHLVPGSSLNAGDWADIADEWNAALEADGATPESAGVSVIVSATLDNIFPSPADLDMGSAVVLGCVDDMIRSLNETLLDTILFTEAPIAVIERGYTLSDEELPVPAVQVLTAEDITRPVSELTMPVLDVEKLERARTRIIEQSGIQLEEED